MPEMKEATTQQPQAEDEQTEEQPKEEMCCDGEKTAHEHRKEAADGKCCVD